MASRSVIWIRTFWDAMDDAVADSPKMSLLFLHIALFMVFIFVQVCLTVFSLFTETGEPLTFNIPWFIWLVISVLIMLLFMKRREYLATSVVRVEVRSFWGF